LERRHIWFVLVIEYKYLLVVGRWLTLHYNSIIAAVSITFPFHYFDTNQLFFNLFDFLSRYNVIIIFPLWYWSRELLNIWPFEQRNIPSIDPKRTVPSYTCCHYFTVHKLKMNLSIRSSGEHSLINSRKNYMRTFIKIKFN